MTDNNVIKFLSLEDLIYDKDNPRLPKSISRSNDAILDWMLSKENIIELMNSIGEKGFFPGEPILVVKDQNKYVVIEGNRRYTASLLLSAPEMAPIKKMSVNDAANNANHRPSVLPSLVFLSREDIIDYLGYRHITGVEAWDALAKARYLAQLYSRLDGASTEREKYKTLAKQIGSTPTYVRQLLLGKQIYDEIENNNFFDIAGLDDKTFEFGTFYTAIVKPNIAKYTGIDLGSESPIINLDISNLEDLTKWMFEKNSENQTRLGESRNLSKLDKILDPKYANALTAFKSDGVSLSIAVDLTDEADEIVSKKINDAQRSLELAWNYFPKVKDYSAIDKDQLKGISKLIRFIYDNLIERQNSNSEIEIP